MWVRSLGWEDAGGGVGNPLQYSCLENPMRILSSQRSLAGYSPWDCNKSDTMEHKTEANIRDIFQREMGIFRMGVRSNRPGRNLPT